MPHQFFKYLKGHAGIEEVGGKGMPQTVRGIMARQASGREVLMHQPIDLGPEEVCPMTFRTRKERQAGRVMRPPDLKGLLHIWRQIHDAIDLPGRSQSPERRRPDPCLA